MASQLELLVDESDSQSEDESAKWESRIAENAARITARYQLYTSIARYILLMLLALITVLIFKSEISEMIQPIAEPQNPDSKAISDFMVRALSGDLGAQQRLSQGIRNLPIDLGDQSLSDAERIGLVAEYLNNSGAQAVYQRELTGDAIIPEYIADGEIKSIQLSPNNVVAQSLFAEPVIVNAATEIKKATRKPSRILLLSNPKENAYVISSVKTSKQLKVHHTKNEWAEVSLHDGIPVWVSKQQIEKYAKGYARVTENDVAAYSGPSTTESAKVGTLEKDDVLQLIRVQGDWYRVWSPVSFTAWVKSSDLAAL